MVKVLNRYITHIPYVFIKIPPSEKNIENITAFYYSLPGIYPFEEIFLCF